MNTKKVADVFSILYCIVSMVVIIIFIFYFFSGNKDRGIIEEEIIRKLDEYDYPDIVKKDILNNVHDRNTNLKRLELLLRIFRLKEKKPSLDKDRFKMINGIRKYIGDKFIGNSEVVDSVVTRLMVNIYFKFEKRQPFGFYGAPGVGKTYLSKLIAESQGLCYGFISLNGLTDLKAITGFSSTYVASAPGRIIEIIDKCGMKNPVIILDEVDKLSFGLQFGLLNLIDETQNEKFVDYFIGFGYDISKVQFILTANEIENVYPILANRLSFFKFKEYTSDEKIKIAKLTVKDIFENDYHIPFSNELYDESLNKVVSQCFNSSENGSVRNIKRVFGKIIENRISTIIRNRLTNGISDPTSFFDTSEIKNGFNIKKIQLSEINCNL